jgi:hypothetical protein
VSTIPERVAFIRKIHLFSDLSDDDLKDVAGALSDEQFKDGERIIEQGKTGGTFYILYRGRVKVTRRRRNHEEVLAYLVPQDYFGEEELLRNRPRTASIIAMGDSSVLSLHRNKMGDLLKRAPKLKPTLQVVIEGHRLWRKLRFKWVRPDESVYFLARKHSILLWRSLFAPIAFMFLPALIMLWGGLTGATWAASIAGVVELFLAGWAVWRVVDWGNDYYVVTNQRVIWVEKVVGLFDSRTEAPLNTVLSVGVETDAMGRVLDYGNVIIRTFVGKIPFNYVSHPRHAAHMIEEYWGRSKEVGLSAEKEAMKDSIRKRLNLPIPPKPAPPPVETPKFSRLRRPSAFGIALSHLFSVRLEEGETVTYRKHGFVLWQQVSQPSFFLFVILVLWIARQVTLASNPDLALLKILPGFKFNVDTISMTLPLVGIPFLLWWIYQYMDWSNDIFQVTPDQVIDIDKKPFGAEERRTAPIENILSTNSQRTGFLGNIFNFGTVYITVGGTQLEFQDVLDPMTVQSDIDRRRMARTAAKNAAAAAIERERIAEWIAAYHRNADEFRAQEQQRDNPNPG